MREAEYTEELAIDSSAIARALWNENTDELYVFFHGSQVPAGYSGFNHQEVKAFETAQSQGSYYQRAIKGQFRGIDTGDLYFVKVEPRIAPAPVVAAEPDEILPTQTYKVSYTCTDYALVSATSFDQAAQKVRDSNDDATVTGVTIV